MPFTEVFPPGRRDEDVAALYIMKFPELNKQHITTNKCCKLNFLWSSSNSIAPSSEMIAVIKN